MNQSSLLWLNVKQQSRNIPELILSQLNENEKDEDIENDIEIIPSNILRDDFVQLHINKYNEQSNVVCSIDENFSILNTFVLMIGQ